MGEISNDIYHAAIDRERGFYGTQQTPIRQDHNELQFGDRTVSIRTSCYGWEADDCCILDDGDEEMVSQRLTPEKCLRETQKKDKLEKKKEEKINKKQKKQKGNKKRGR